ncbi:hypothetical protein HYH02_013168 [Chlamydomonas schloesseri]|uniref:Uncharacterized protein n=1 Tax=Chlamydomonas schloesseri TaxID=2026947 RepID=A0A835VXW3_9CHLO|nr:hypothetical protein HYH02_013168 [Chlamydomonas schloesseri]|eukprot:KAG2431950.1 hypothetical protein HYH02_013168 [Chlamydomonas schloesseri]
MKELHDKLAAHVRRCPKDPQEVLRAAREKVTFRSKLQSYGDRLLRRQDEREFRQPEARLQYGKLNGGILCSNPYHNPDEDDWSSSDSDRSDSDTDGRTPPPAPGVLPCAQNQQVSEAAATPAAAAAAATSAASPPAAVGSMLRRSSSWRRTSAVQMQQVRLRPSDYTGVDMDNEFAMAAVMAADSGSAMPASPPGGMPQQRRPSMISYDGGSGRPGLLGRGHSFTISGSSSRRGAEGSASSGAGGVAVSALSSTADVWSGATAGISSSRALKPTHPAPLRAAASFTLGSGGSRPGTAAAANWARARTAAGLAAAACAQPQPQSAQQQRPPSSSGGFGLQAQLQQPSSLQVSQQNQHVMLQRRQTSPNYTELSNNFDAEVAAPRLQAAQQQLPAPLTRALSLQLNRLASSIGINYPSLGRRESQLQEAVATELAGELHTHAGLAEEDEEARDRLHMLRSGNSAAGEQVERSWRSFTMGLRRHTTTDGSYGSTPAGAGTGVGGFGAAAIEKSFTAGGGFAQFRSSSVRISFVPEEEEEEEEEKEEAQDDGKHGRYGAYPARPGTGARRATTSNLMLPPSCEGVIRDRPSATPAGAPALMTQPPPSLQAWASNAAAKVHATSSAGDGGAALPTYSPHPPASAAAALALRSRSFTAARRSSVWLSAAGLECTHPLPDPGA